MSWYKTGTVSVVQGSNAVLGVGTDFVSNTQRGNIFIGPDGAIYEIDQIVDLQNLHLAKPYAGTTAQGALYSIVPTQAYVQQLTQSATSLLNTFGSFRDDYLAGNLVGKGLQLKGVLSSPDQLPVGPAVGDGYLVNSSIYVWTGPSWQSASIKGDQGIPGDITPAYVAIGNQVASDAVQTAADRVATSQNAAAAAAAANTATSQASIASNQANSAVSASSVATMAASSLTSALAAFRSVFIGDLPFAPSVDGNGNPLKSGVEYFDTTKNKLQIYSNGVWGDYDQTAQAATNNAALSASSAAVSASAAQASAAAASASASTATANQLSAAASASSAATSANAASSSVATATAEANIATAAATAAAASAATAQATNAAATTAAIAASNGASLVGFIQPLPAAVKLTAQTKLAERMSIRDFGLTGNGSDESSKVLAAISALKSTNGGRLESDGTPVSISSKISIDGELSKGSTLDFAHTTLNYSSGTGFVAGSYANAADQRRSKIWFKDLNITGPGKAVGGTTAFEVNETADIFMFGGCLRDSSQGLWLNGGLLCDFYSPTIRANGTGIVVNGTVNFSANHNTFYSAKLFDNNKAIAYDGPGLAGVNWIGCEIEGNNTSGTSTDGVSVIKLTNAGRHNFIGCHLEDNLGQIALDYAGSSADKNLLILGSELVSGASNEVMMRSGKLTAIASYIATGASSNNINIANGATATLIDTDSQVVGDKSHLLSLNYGRIAFGNQAYSGNAPITIFGTAYYANIAQLFQADSTIIQFNNAAGSRIAYLFSGLAGVYLMGDGVPATMGQNSGARFVVGRANLMSVEPGADNNTTCGSAAVRFSTVYAGTGAINTSDGRLKQQIRDINEVEMQVAKKLKGLLRAFKFNDAVEKKGSAARIHFGVVAQDVETAFTESGLDPKQYAIFCYDEWDAVDEVKDDDGNVITPKVEAGNRYGIRYDELFAFVISAI